MPMPPSLDYISNRLGSLSFVRGKFGATGEDGDRARDYVDKERLAYAWEISEAFARGTIAPLLMVDGQPPMAIERLTFENAERIRRSIRHIRNGS